jgi:hypothetical protein
MDVTTATPAEIDTEIARLDDEMAGIARQIEMLQAKMDKVRKAAGPLYAEYARRGWTRVYRVDNSNGHVHTTTACSTTYETTGFHWFPELSGLPARQIVTLAGEYTCLTCFGQVRAEILEAREGRPCRIETPGQRKTREDREAQAVVRAARDAAKQSKALVAPVRVDGWTVSTKADAWIRLTDAVIDADDWRDESYSSYVSPAQRASNVRRNVEDARILRAALRESSPELTDEAFAEMEAKKVVAKKKRYNRELRAAGMPARYEY